MHIDKIKQANNYIFTHCDRSYSGEYNGTSNIDESRTILNFNCSENNRHRVEQLQYIKEQTGKKVRANAVAAFGLILTLPREYFPRMQEDNELLHQFFQDGYECIRDFFNLKDSDVASAWVHMDEDTPHMHFLGTPLVRDEKGCHLFYDKCIPREKYMTYHPKIEQAMRERGWDDLNLLNGNTRDFNLTVNQLKAKSLKEENEKIESEIALKKKDLSEIKGEIESLTLYASKLKKNIKNLTNSKKMLTFYDRYQVEIMILLSKIMDRKEVSPKLKQDFYKMLVAIGQTADLENIDLIAIEENKKNRRSEEKEEVKDDTDRECETESKEHISKA